MLDNLEAQIEYFKVRCAWQANRGRISGTYDHQRLSELLAYQKNLRSVAKAKTAAASNKKITKTTEVK